MAVDRNELQFSRITLGLRIVAIAGALCSPRTIAFITACRGSKVQAPAFIIPFSRSFAILSRGLRAAR